MVTRDRRLTLRRLSDELYIIRRQFVKSPMKISRRGRSVQSSSHTDSRISRRNRDSHHAKASSRLLKAIPISWLHFSFLRWKLPSKERGFSMLKALWKTWRLSWMLFLWRPLLTVLNNIWFPYNFYFHFHTSPGTLLPDHVEDPHTNASSWRNKKFILNFGGNTRRKGTI
jgi:hypothetical protein